MLIDVTFAKGGVRHVKVNDKLVKDGAKHVQDEIHSPMIAFGMSFLQTSWLPGYPPNRRRPRVQIRTNPSCAGLLGHVGIGLARLF